MYQQHIELSFSKSILQNLNVSESTPAFKELM